MHGEWPVAGMAVVKLFRFQCKLLLFKTCADILEISRSFFIAAFFQIRMRFKVTITQKTSISCNQKCIHIGWLIRLRSSNLYQQSYHFRLPDHLRAPHLQKTRALHLIFPVIWRLEIETWKPTKTWEIWSFNSHPNGIRFTYTSMVLNVISGVKNSGNSFDCFVDAIAKFRSNQQNYLGNQFPPVLFLNDFCQIPTNCQQKNHKIW